MAEFVGLAISIVTLVDSCLTVSRLYSTSQNFSLEAKTLRLMLARQDARLTCWAKSWGMALEEGTGVPSPMQDEAKERIVDEARRYGLDLPELESTLENMWELLSEGKRLQNRQDRGTQSDKQSIISKTHIRSQMGAITSRLRWVTSDKDHLRTLISDLKEHNDMLERLQPRLGVVSQHSQETAITCEVMVSADIIGLPTISEADEASSHARQTIEMRQRQLDSETSSNHWNRYQDLNISQWEYKLSSTGGRFSGERPLVQFRAGKNTGPVIDALIEWKYYAASVPKSKNLALSRVERVAQLLNDTSKFPQLRILECIGYFQDSIKSRCGILYKLPEAVPRSPVDSAMNIQVTRLKELFKVKIRPSLAARFNLAHSLASSMLDFHMAGWLHKDFSSNNVIFFLPKDSSLHTDTLSAPYIASFGLARPDQQFEESEAISSSSSSADPAYHHPDYHFPTSTTVRDGLAAPRYHREFDVYSLGVVLLEIGLWKPLAADKSLVGWKKDKALEPSELPEWRQKLLSCAANNLPFMAGPTYADVVLGCLRTEVKEGRARRESQRMLDLWDEYELKAG
ncbi:MAG: hypothetical protein M1837_002009 [Sclerophora amabilis]|nr:MAG: hypothetical protein M1837_002009 [Sclerophora amabilis]